jgi:hypothetical protein
MAPDTCEHAWVSHVRGGEPLAVQTCTLCQAVDWDDLRAQAEAIEAEARAKACRQISTVLRQADVYDLASQVFHDRDRPEGNGEFVERIIGSLADRVALLPAAEAESAAQALAIAEELGALRRQLRGTGRLEGDDLRRWNDLRQVIGTQFDMNPTVDGRDPDAYSRYATRLDVEVPGWWWADIDMMTDGLYEEAWRRRVDQDRDDRDTSPKEKP